jgi:SAM-dependent methyltransferase
MSDLTDLHPAASAGFSAGAPTYVRGRPNYPEALLGWLREALQLHAATTAVDLGAGTGKFTALLRRTGARIIAVEPVAAMRSQFTDLLPHAGLMPDESAPILMAAGMAEALPLHSSAVDAVVCAQAFHWFAAPAALSEIHRVLRPGGRLGLVWNVRDETVDWVAAITAVLAPYEGDAPRFTSGRWRDALARSAACGLFSEPQAVTWSHEAGGSPEHVIIERFLSVSFIAALPADEQARVRQRLQHIIDTHPRLRGRAQITLPYVTHAYSCTAL